MPLSENTPAWPEDIRFRKETSIDHGFRTSKLTMSSHSGTHIDAKAHLAGYGTSIAGIPLSRLILPALVIDCGEASEIDSSFIEDLSLEGKALLLKTAIHPSKPLMEYSYLSRDAAELAVSKGTLTIGINTLSVDAPDSAIVHEILLGNSVPVLENLLLDNVLPGEYLLICIPMKIEFADAYPARAFLQVLEI